MAWQVEGGDAVAQIIKVADQILEYPAMTEVSMLSYHHAFGMGGDKDVADEKVIARYEIAKEVLFAAGADIKPVILKVFFDRRRVLSLFGKVQRLYVRRYCL